jgi:hypothetical protein
MKLVHDPDVICSINFYFNVFLKQLDDGNKTLIIMFLRGSYQKHYG